MVKNVSRPLLIFFLCLIIVGCGNVAPGGCVAQRWNLGGLAPDFTLPQWSSSGDKPPVQLSDVYSKGPVLLVFWATWCPSCVQEIPVLNEWYQKYQGRLQIFAVNLEESRETLQKFFELYPVQSPVLMDQKGKVANQYGLIGLPAAILIAKGGKIIYYGFELPANIENLIQTEDFKGETRSR